jgi:ADP-heptose:LPS heptosyltransferase
MDIEFQRRVDRTVGKLVCFLLSLFFNHKKSGSFKPKPSKILVILLSEMGSLVLAKPMFEHIKKKYPGTSVYVLLFDKNREILGILDVVPPENMVSIRDVSFATFFIDSFRALSLLRKLKIDSVVDCELFSRIGSIYSFLSGAKIRAGFHPYTQEGLYRGSFINRPVLYNPYHHISHQFITLVEALESDLVPSVKRKIHSHPLGVAPLKFSRHELETLFNQLKSDFPVLAGKKLILIYPGGGVLPIRAWPLDNFCFLAKALIEKGHVVGIIGTEKEKKLGKEILSRCQSRNCIDLTGYTKSIKELIFIFHFASLLVANDGGPGHFSVLTTIASIILYGPETPYLYGPLSPNAVSLYVPLSCSPCLTAYNHRNSPCDGDNLCMKNITPEQVMTKVGEILQKQERNDLHF